MALKIRRLRIHGDNIIECERTLSLLAQALKITFTPAPKGTLFRPIHQGQSVDGIFEVELLSGHDRWGVCIGEVLQNNGGILREGADSYVTEIDNNIETVLFALEYCSALPAGNNAWQRSGRAYSSILAGIPYIYIAELGGVELDADRQVKAPRFPNPVVPYSYIATTSRMTQFCIPIYAPHPSITDKLYNQYKNIFGLTESLAIIKGIVLHQDYSGALKSLQLKGIEMVKLLSSARRNVDTLRGTEWDDLFNSQSTLDYLKNSALTWKKTLGAKVKVSRTFRQIHQQILSLRCKTIGSVDLPICIVAKEKLSNLENIINGIYPAKQISFDKTKDLVIVWITGFKPRGDDSRPDRGLTPLAKMVVGNEGNIMAIVSGPAKTSTWDHLQRSREELAKENGLWQSILNISRYVLVDSSTCASILFYELNGTPLENTNPVTFQYSSKDPDFGEHDTDSAIHSIFARKEHLNILEALCNPPGGDWSGISYFGIDGTEYRWTSLPRVSANAKRPDHLIQVMEKDIDTLIIIESKQRARDLENNVGDGLKAYITELFSVAPTAYRKQDKDWRLYDSNTYPQRKCQVFSVGAFIYENEAELSVHMQRGNLDAMLAFEFGANTCLHVLAPTAKSSILAILKKILANIPNIKVQIH